MPPTNPLQDSIRNLVDSFTAELTQLVRQVAFQQVEQAFGGDMGNGSAPRKRGRPVGSGRKATTNGRRGRRSSIDHAQMGEALLAHVKANPGQRGEQIAAALRSDVKSIRPAMQKLIASRQVKTQGQRRGMTYHPANGRSAPTAPTSASGRKGARRGKGASKARRSKNGRRGKRTTKAQAKTNASEAKQAA